MIVLNGYLFLNLLIGWSTLDAEHKDEPVLGWVKPLVILSIPWAVSIHTVTAFIYQGLAARPSWYTALWAPRFLASAFASGPSLLILMALLIRRMTPFDPGLEAIRKVAKIVTYALLATIFLFLVELFTILYGDLPHDLSHLRYLFLGLEGHSGLVPWMWTSVVLMVLAAITLLAGGAKHEGVLAVTCFGVFVAIWIDKGLGLIVPGFVPSPLGQITDYVPTLAEALITAGIWAVGFLIVTVFYKVTVGVRSEQ
jgi:molybdopterin-containing oxidoreductase family membrane subunit